MTFESSKCCIVKYEYVLLSHGCVKGLSKHKEEIIYNLLSELAFIILLCLSSLISMNRIFFSIIYYIYN